MGDPHGVPRREAAGRGCMHACLGPSSRGNVRGHRRRTEGKGEAGARCMQVHGTMPWRRAGRCMAAGDLYLIEAVDVAEGEGR